MRRLSDATTVTLLMGVMAVSLAIAVVGLCIQIGWVGRPVGSEGGWVGDVSAGVYGVALVATFVLTTIKQDARRRK
jgi:hypothetical protein